uniref:Angiopoietin-2-like n=1 Tax=Actinia tenebrosa TaxID=6105 RepID=A0A6P8HHX9_ACTTE
MISPPHLIVNESQSALFHYSIRGNPQPLFGWSKVGGSLDTTRSIVNSSRGILEIKHVTFSDSGIYQCNASSILGKALATTRLVVNYRPRVSLKKGPIYVKIGDNVTLPTCHVMGHPKPRVTWSRSIGKLPSNRTLTRDNELTLFNVVKDDSGTYVCTSDNFLGSDAAGCVLVVVQLPVFVVRPPNISYAIVGSSLTLNCSAKGDPEQVISWRRENGALPSGRYEITPNGSLVLRNIQASDDDIYVCSATSAGVFDVQVKSTLNIFYHDCSEIYKSGERRSGVYTIKPDSERAFQVYCDMTTDGGGWTVFQRRQDGSVDFYRDWQQYKTGFGNLNGEFWLGNDYIHRLTEKTPSVLRVELEDWNRNKKYAKYGSFSVGDESDKYRLKVASYSGDAGDSLISHHNNLFSTKDRDNDKHQSKCTTLFGGAWWYRACYDSNLNGKYFGNKRDEKGIAWEGFHYDLSLKYSEMKIRPISF